MTTEIATFTCSICGEPSTEICAYCTKDTCPNHRCERCKRCSDCCECEVHLTASGTYRAPEPAPVEHVDPEPEPEQEPEVLQAEKPEPAEAPEPAAHETHPDLFRPEGPGE